MITHTETRATNWHPCKDAPWYPSLPGGGIVAYRIWQQFDGRRWFQRHEWRNADWSLDLEDWIVGAAGWCVGSKQVNAEAEVA